MRLMIDFVTWVNFAKIVFILGIILLKLWTMRLQGVSVLLFALSC